MTSAGFCLYNFLCIDSVVYLWYNKDTIKQGDDIMPQIIPIRDLKNTSQISEICHSSNEPVFVTKNGYGDMVNGNVNKCAVEIYPKFLKLL